MAVSDLRFPRDNNAEVMEVMPLNCDSNNLLLAAATNESITVPAKAKFVRISSSAEAWVGLATFGVTVPAVDSTGGSAGVCLRANMDYMFSCDTLVGSSLHFIATGTPLINICFF